MGLFLGYHKFTELWKEAYEDARREASEETALPVQTFPEECQWTYDQVMDSDFWPNGTE
jgi:8-oxo-dGTP pyrophosphatase MutT (NUDIX family)